MGGFGEFCFFFSSFWLGFFFFVGWVLVGLVLPGQGDGGGSLEKQKEKGGLFVCMCMYVCDRKKRGRRKEK
jgi:hypothetical protein